MLQTVNSITYGYFIDRRFDLVAQKTVSRLVQIMPGQGCVPWRKTGGKICPFCQFPATSRTAVLGPGHEDHFEPWPVDMADYAEMIDHSFEAAPDVDKVVCFNGGSFLTDLEIPKAARLQLYNRFVRHPKMTSLMVESRPEFVLPEMLDEAADVIGDKTFTVAIGLESMDDHVRNKLLKKAMGIKRFHSAVKMLQERGMKVFVYVFLGGPGLSEDEAYQDAESSVRQLADLGVDEIALSCAFVPPGGQLEKWYNEGSFEPPRLWTIARLIEVAKQNGWPLSLGGFDDFPPPVAIPANCGICDPALHSVFDTFRETNAFDPRDLPVCKCRG